MSPSMLRSVCSVAVREDQGTAVFRVSLWPPNPAQQTVNYATTDNSAVQPDDYGQTSGTLTFAPYDTEEFISVSIVDDKLIEETENFLVNLSSGSQTILVGQGVGVIVDNDFLAYLRAILCDCSCSCSTVTASAGPAATAATVSVGGTAKLRASPAIPQIAVLPRAPRTGSPVPWLTSLYHKSSRGDYGDPRYPGNCSGELIKDLLKYFQPNLVFDPMTGSGTCKEVCTELGIDCCSDDIRFGFDASDPATFPRHIQFDFVWLHPPYWRMKRYTAEPADLSNAATPAEFYECLRRVILNCREVLTSDGKLAILMGDYCDRDAGFVPLTYHTKRLAFECGLRQTCTDIIRFSHGATSSKRSYTSSFIPGLHDTLALFQKRD